VRINYFTKELSQRVKREDSELLREITELYHDLKGTRKVENKYN
jgi:hypothetical protein